MKQAAVLTMALLMSASGYWDTLSSNSWYQPDLGQTPPIRAQIMGWERAVYASAINSIVVAGGYFARSSEAQNALMAYSARENRWNILDIGPASSGAAKSEFICVAGHDFNNTAYDESTNCYFLNGSWAMGNKYFGLCHYDVMGHIGRLYFSIPGNTINKTSPASCYDPDSQCFYFIGGACSEGKGLTRYRVKEHAFKQLASPPGCAKLSFADYDRRLKKVVVVTALESATQNNATWTITPGPIRVYDPAANSWTEAAATHPLTDAFKNFTYDPSLGKFVSLNRATQTTWTYDLSSNRWDSLPVAWHAGIADNPTWPIAYSGSDNLYISVTKAETNYRGTVHAMRLSGTSATPLPEPPARVAYRGDTRWTALGGAIQDNPSGFARFPRILGRNGNLFLAWTEFSPAAWSASGTTNIMLSRWNSGNWLKLGKLGTFHNNDFASLAVIDSTLYVGADTDDRNYRTYRSDKHCMVYRYAGGRIDTMTADSQFINGSDSTHLPQLVPYRGGLDLMCVNGPLSDQNGGLAHARWNADSGRFVAVQKHVETKEAPRGEFLAKGALRSPFSTAVLRDTLYAAYTYFQESADHDRVTKPYVVRIKRYDGAAWSLAPAVTAGLDSFVCTHPCLAADTAGKKLYVAYLKRRFLGRHNNELVVERLTGSAWEPVGGPLNVNRTDKDAWAFRPSLAVNSTGVLYAAWTEHVWGSCPQVYVAHWNGYAWVNDFDAGTTLNADTVTGSAQSVSLTFVDDKPTVAWCEHTFGNGSFRKVYVKQLNEVVNGPEAAKVHSAGILNLTAAPNPFGRSVAFNLTFPASGAATLSIYGPDGSLVRRLISGEAGGRNMAWDGCDSRGRACGQGIYAAVLKAAGMKRTLLVSRIR